jgi:chitinase
MKTKLIILFSFIAIFCACTDATTTKKSTTTNENTPKIIAYVTGYEDNWGDTYEKATQITHINYAFANIKDGKVIEGSDNDAVNIQKLNSLKNINPNLQVLISVGGWSWSGNFSDAVLTENSREIFANSAIEFMLNHKLDGIDLDWEYPGQVGAGNVHRIEDKENFTAILQVLRNKLDSLQTTEKKFLLTIATAANQSYLDHTNMNEAHKYLDFINIMTYDFYTGSSNKTGHHANLAISNSDTNINKQSAMQAVEQHINAGIPANKLVLGVPFYGRWWKGVNPINNGLYQQSTGETGSLRYAEIVIEMTQESGYTTFWDESAKTPYIWNEQEKLFLTFENEKSLEFKIKYVQETNLGGIMFWQYNGDNGQLLSTINKHLK